MADRTIIGLDKREPDLREVTTKTQRMEMEESGIVCCAVLEDVLLDLEGAKENIAAVKLLANGKSVPVLVDIGMAKGVTKEARAYLAGDEIAMYQSACALLVSSLLSQLIGNFFLGLNRTKFPIRLFQDTDKAKEWLKTFL